MPKPKKKEFSSLKVKQKKRPSLMKQLSQPFYSAKKKNKFVNGVHPLPNSSAKMQNEKELILVVDDNLFVPLRREIDEEKIFALAQEETLEPLIGPNLLKLKIEPHEMYSSVDSGYASPPVQGDFHTIPKGILKKMSPTLSNQVSDASSISPSVTSSEKIGEVFSLPFNANYCSANISVGTKNGSSGLQNERPMSPSGQSMSPMARAFSQNNRPLSPNETPSSPHERPMSPYGMAAIEDAFDLLDSIIEENGQNCLNTGATLAAKRKVVKKSVSFGHVTEIQKICNDFDDTFEDLAVVRKSVSFDRLDELKEESEYSKEIEENHNDLSQSNRRLASLDNVISHECHRDNVISHECHGDISDLKDIGHLTCEVELKMIEITPLPSDPAAMEHDLSISTVLQSFQIMVCHHPSCTEKNGNHPLLLCKECDHHIHQDPNASGHLVLDAPKKKNAQSNIAKHLSSPNLLQSEETGRSDQDNTEKDEGVDTSDHPDGVTTIKKTPKPEGDKVHESAETEGGKLKRKKVIKGKRRHTDGVRSHSAGDIYSPVLHGNESDEEDESNNNYRNSYHGESIATNKSVCNEERTERRPSTPDNCSPHPRYHPISKSMVSHENFTVCFTDVMGGEEDIEVVAAVKHLSLSDALQPMLERRGKDLNNYNAFVEASKTPLPLNCETFLLGGNSLYIREKDGETLPPSGSQSLSKATGAKLTGGKGQNSKNSKAGMSRRDSMAGRMYTLLEPPPNGRQRRSSLQLPFQAFFPSPKAGDGTRANDESSGSLRSRRGINLSIDESIFPMSLSASVSPQGTVRENDSRKAKGQNKLTNLFSPLSKDKEKQDQLSEILNGYSINGLPSPPSLLQIGQPRFNEEVFSIEPHWSSLVDNASALTKRQHDQQEAIWELLQTELHYIQSLRVIADLFLCVLLNIQNQMLLNEIETEKLLSNIGEIATCNSIFWEMYLCKVVQQSRTYRSPLNPSLIKEGFKKFPELFHPYINYCSYQKSCQEYMKVQYSDNDLFKMFVIWAETQKQCNRLKLSDLLVKPMQRLTKYSLLLQAILRKTDDDIQRKDLLEMIASVDKFVTFVNSTLRKQHEEERLQSIADKIETYDAVDAPNDECLKIIQQYNGNFNLLAPMQGCNPEEIRSLIMQSALKMKDNQSRMDVECLLFTDLLLICKSNKRMDKYKILKPPMRVDRVIVHEIKDKGSFLLIYINEYHVPVSSFTFHADQASVRVWTEHIRKAQTMYHEARQRAIQNLDQPQYLGTEIVEEQVIGYQPLVMPDNPPQLHLTHCDSFESQRDGNLEALINLEGSEPESQLSRSRSWNDMEHTVDNSSSNSDSKGDYSPSLPNKKHKVVQYSNSEPSILKPGEERLQVPSVHSQSLYDESLPDIMDENLRMKLNQRRTSRTEKRYYTADAVQEIQRQEGKDTSIYKRLSWNFGTGEQTSEKDNIIRSRIQSSDSLRSVHSSSGVSSTGSLHLSPEGDICEDIILESNSHNKGVDNNEDSSETECTLDTLNEDDYKPHFLIPSVKQSRSKSTSDIVALIQEMSTGDLKDGISSVDLPKTEVQKMKLSHSELMRMTKKLILSASDIEASEV